MNEVLEEILAERARDCAIARESVLAWMATEEPEALGALYHSLGDSRFRSRVTPPLSFDDYQMFGRRYFGYCILSDPKGVWVDSRYSAGWDLVGWIISLWRDRKEHEAALLEWKQWLAQMYRDGDEAVRTCLETATLEHLFEHRGMAKFFEDWKDAPVLSQAYKQASNWMQEGGESPLGKRS